MSKIKTLDINFNRIAERSPAQHKREHAASSNVIRQRGWLLRKKGEYVAPLANAMLGEPGWFASQISAYDLDALIGACLVCASRADTRKLMLAFLPSKMVNRWCPPQGQVSEA